MTGRYLLLGIESYRKWKEKEIAGRSENKLIMRRPIRSGGRRRGEDLDRIRTPSPFWSVGLPKTTHQRNE